MHKFFFAFLLLTVTLSNIGCSPSTKMTIVGSWVDKEKIQATQNNGVLIVAMTQNMEVRSSLERNLAAAAAASGIKAVQSLQVFTPVTGVPDSVVIAAFLRKVEESGCTAILTIAVIDSKSETEYHSGASYTYNPYGAYPYYGTFASYYSYSYSTYYSPGYYTTKSTYFLESNLYAYPSQELLFSVQTKAVNPSDITKGSQKFTELLVEELKSNGLLKKKS